VPEGLGRAPSLPARLVSILYLSRWHIASLSLAAVATVLILQVLLRYPHPPGADGGQWLSIANEFRGQGVSRVGSLAYPPLYLLLLTGLVVAMGDPAAAIFASIAVVLAVLSLSSYASYHLVTGEPKGALVFQALISFSFVFFDMLSWGGYPSLLSIAFLCLALAFLHRASMPGAARREHVFLGIAGGLVFLTHPLSAVLFAIGASLYFVMVQLQRRDRGWFKASLLYTLPAFALLYLPYLALRWGGASGGGVGLPNYLIEQPVYSVGLAFYPLVPTELRRSFPFTNNFTVLLSIVLALLSLLPLPTLLHRKRILPGLAWLLRPLGHRRAARAYVLFVSSFIPPLLLPVVLWWRNLYTDYSRILFYLLLPLAAGLACLLERVARPGTIGELRVAAVRHLRLRSPKAKPASSSSLSRARVASRPRRIAAAAVPWVAIFVFLTLHSDYGLDYLRGASDYYIDFKDPADMDLARWVRENTAPDDLIALSPDWANQFKWLEGLSGRRALGYAEPRFLFYEREIQVNADIYRMFSQRYSVVGSGFEVSTAGASENSPFQIRFSVLDRRGAYPVLQLTDAGMQTVLGNGSGPFVSEFVERWVTVAGPGEIPAFADGAIVERATKDSPPIALRLEAGPTSTGAELAVREVSPREGFTGLFMTASSTGWPCSLRVSGSALEWGVKGEAGNCLVVRVTGSPAMDIELTGYSAKLLLRPDANGAATIRMEAPGALPGTVLPKEIVDSKELFEEHGISFAVVPALNIATLGMLQREYGFPLVYRNARHAVLRASPELAGAELELSSWIGNHSAPGETVLFAPRSGWHAETEVLRTALGRRPWPPVESGPVPSGRVGSDLHHMLSDRVVVEDAGLSIAFHGTPLGDESGLGVAVAEGGLLVPALDIPDTRTYVEWSGGGGIFLSEMVWGEAGVEPGTGPPGVFNRYVKDAPSVDLRRTSLVSGSGEIAYRSAPEGPGIAAYVLAISPVAPTCSIATSAVQVDMTMLVGGSCVGLRLSAPAGLEVQYVGDVVIIRLPVSAPGEARLRIERLDGGAGSPGAARAFEVRGLFDFLPARLVVVPAGEDAVGVRLAANFGAVKEFENSQYWVYRLW